MEGKPLGHATSFRLKSVVQLADRLAGSSEEPKKNSSLSGLRSLFSRTS